MHQADILLISAAQDDGAAVEEVEELIDNVTLSFVCTGLNCSLEQL